MAFTIKIYEKDRYVFTLLKKRLSSFFPDAYIIDPYFDPEDPDDRFSNYTKVIYDPSDINEEDIPQHSLSLIRLTDDGGLIDCARLIPMLRPNDDLPTVLGPVTGTLSAVIPFVYSDVRDRFISDISSRLQGAEINIRLDFTSKLRAGWRGPAGCNMTSLLEACKSKRFVPEDILKYCNMDDMGFLTPGSTAGHDDVYDLGIRRSGTLLDHASRLAHSRTGSSNVLAVVEGFRTMDLPELLCSCDMVYILLPSKSTGEIAGAKDLIALLTKTLGRERITVCYADNSAELDKNDSEEAGRRLVV